jgi:micrococcal nuclease
VRSLLPVFVVGVLAVSLAACDAAPPTTKLSSPSAARESVRDGHTFAASTTATTFISVIDGDTIDTQAGTVRLIGIDTPERGECGHDEASRAIGRLVSHGDLLTLVLPDGQNGHDRYDRLLRYVVTAHGTDLGLMQLESGNAIARYDSRDGYPAHSHEAAYRAAQVASVGPNRTVITSSCAAKAATESSA